MENQKNDFVTVDQIFNKIRRRKWTLIVCVAVCVLLAMTFNHFATSYYKAPALISFEQYNKDDMLNFGFGGAQYESNFITNRIREIKTWTFAEKVYQTMPDSIRRHFVSENPEALDFDIERNVIQMIQNSINVKRPEKTSSVLEISFVSKNADISKVVTNTIIDVLMNSNLVYRRQEYTNLREFVDEQIKIVEQKLETSEEALQQFKNSHNIASLEDEAREILNRITQAEVFYNNIIADTKAKQRKLVVIQQKINEQKENVKGSIPETTDPLITKLKEELIQLELESASLQVQGYSEDHPRRISVDSEIDQVKNNLSKLTMGVIQDQNMKGIIDPLSTLKNYLVESVALETEIQALNAQQKHLRGTLVSYNNRLKSLSNNDATLFGLLRDREVNNKIYVNLLEEREQARLKEAAEIGIIRVIEQAQTPLDPYLPRKKLNLIIGFFTGVLIGLAIIFLKDSFNDMPDSEQDIESMLNLPVLASIQKIKSRWTVSLNGDHSSYQHIIYTFRDAFTYMWYCLQALSNQNVKSVMMTSAGPGEGKSTLSINLAMTAAEMGKKVLLIDGDLRKPSLAKLLNISNTPGLSNLVSPEKITPQSYILHIRGFSFLSAGTNLENSGLIWSLSNLREILPYLMQEYDFVVIDTPPVLGIPDAINVGSYVDATILCIAADCVNKTHVLRAQKLLKRNKINLIGVVWNKVNSMDLYGKYKYKMYTHENS